MKHLNKYLTTEWVPSDDLEEETTPAPKPKYVPIAILTPDGTTEFAMVDAAGWMWSGPTADSVDTDNPFYPFA